MPKRYSSHIIGLSQSSYFGSSNSVSFSRGLNIRDDIGLSFPNYSFDVFNRISSKIETSSAVTRNRILIFDENNNAYDTRIKENANRIGTVRAYKGIDVDTFDLIEDIDTNESVICVKESSTNRFFFGDIDQSGKNTSVRFDDAFILLPQTDSRIDYIGCTINSSFLYTTIGNDKLVRIRLDANGRPITSTIATQDIQNAPSGAEIIGISVHRNLIVILFDNNSLLFGSISTVQPGVVADFAPAANDLSFITESIKRISINDSLIAFSFDTSVSIVSYVGSGNVITVTSPVEDDNHILPTERKQTTGISISNDGGTVLTSRLTSILFSSYEQNSDAVLVLDFEFSSRVLSQQRFGGYMYYTTEYSLGRWDISKDFDTREDMYKSFQIGDPNHHPMFVLYDQLFIGDSNILLSIIETGGKTEVTHNVLPLSKDNTIVDIKRVQNQIVVASNKDVGNASVFIWDISTGSFLTSSTVPEDKINCFLPFGSSVIILAGDKGRLYSYDGYSVQFLQKIPKYPEGVTVRPSAQTQHDGLLLLAVGTFVYSIFRLGNDLIFNIENVLESAVHTLISLSSKTLVAVSNNEVSLRIEDNKRETCEFITRIISVNQKSFQPQSFVVDFRDMTDCDVSVKQVINSTEDKDNIVPLNGDWGRGRKQYVCSKIQSDSQFQFIVSISPNPISNNSFHLRGFDLTY